MEHKCHWLGCSKSVPPRMWGCRKHWFALPEFLRKAIWREYREGQEISKTPSNSYLFVAAVADMWVACKESGLSAVNMEVLNGELEMLIKRFAHDRV